MDNWLRDQRRYQEKVYKVDYGDLLRNAGTRTDYVAMNLTAAMIELGEAYQEVPWKPWAKVDKADAWKKSRDAFVGEVVDVLMFLANALTAVGCTDEELAVRYLQKTAINVRRQESGYDGSDKCTQCRRAFDDLERAASLADSYPEDVWVKITWPTGEKFCSIACEKTHRAVV